ncbi:MAG: hypothetical protein Q9207_001240 [Kuettlingeria erythrocarpa]
MPSLLLGLTFLTLAFPSISCFALSVPVAPRADSDLLRNLPRCQNPPYQYYPAGLLLPDVPPEEPFYSGLKRDAAPKQYIILCTPGTETFIKLTHETRSGDSGVDKDPLENQEQISSLISDAWTWINREHLPPKGQDGIINKGEGWIVKRTSPRGTHELLVANAHHIVPVPRWGGGGTLKRIGNEVTWGVLRAALTALMKYMARYSWTICEFEIWDGMNQVGIAKIRSLI